MKLDHPALIDSAALPLIGPNGDNLLVVIAKGTFTFHSGRSEPAEEVIPIAYGDLFDDDIGAIRYESDILPPKPRTDIILCASAYAPGGKPTQSVAVALKVGKVEKRIMVFGDRFWNYAGVLSRTYAITATKPFTQRPIVYEDAFGGIDAITGQYCAENLVGKGFYTVTSKHHLAGKPLPCIEDPRHLIRHINDRPPPVGFGVYNRAWQPRAAYAGTYDQSWRKGRCPLPPKDFDARFYNSAHPDLQADGYLQGNEAVVLSNLTPEGSTVFHLPNVTLFCQIAHRTDHKHEENKIRRMNLDTLFIEPDKKHFCIVWRTAVSLIGFATTDIVQVTIGLKQG